MSPRQLLPVALVTLSLAWGCASAGLPEGPVVPVAVREAQTRRYDSLTQAAALQTLVDTLQDGDFTIEQADSSIGLIHAARSNTTTPGSAEKLLKWSTIVMTYGLAALLPWTKHETNQLHLSANITPDSSGTRVRFTLEQRQLNGDGRLKRARRIDDPALYRALFEQFERNAFLASAEGR